MLFLLLVGITHVCCHIIPTTCALSWHHATQLSALLIIKRYIQVTDCSSIHEAVCFLKYLVITIDFPIGNSLVLQQLW